jgi:hypothetical protein
MTSYQYAGNNPVMFNDPLGNAKMPPPPQGPHQPIIHLTNWVLISLMQIWENRNKRLTVGPMEQTKL